MPSAVDAIVLLGWMERDFAVKYLMNDCLFDPPLTEPQAAEMWKSYSDRVRLLPEREAPAPQKLVLTPEEEQARRDFLHFHRNQGPQGSIRDVIKIDPMGLVTYQFYIVIDRVGRYSQHADAKTWCARNCLATARNPQQIRVNHTLNVMNIEVPHAEFAFVYDQKTNAWGVLELARHVSVSEFQSRMILWAGYHRSYARMASAKPDGIERSLLVALTTDADFFVSEQSPNQGLRAMVCGLRPPLFRDFFDERLFMTVKLRKKRYELQVRAQTVGVNFN